MSKAGLPQRHEFSGKFVSPAVAAAECYKHQYLAVNALRISGALVPAGGPIDKSIIAPRKLLQMYDRRLIKLAPESAVTITGIKPSAKPRAIGPTDIFNPGSCGHKVVPIKSEPEKPVRVVSKRSAPREKSRRVA